MFGFGLTSYNLSSYAQPTLLPYEVPVPQPYPSPYSVPTPYIQNMIQPVDMPVPHTIQPVVVPQPVPVPVPVSQPCPYPVPVDRPCAVPVAVPVPQPVVVREQVPVPVPVHVPVQMPMQQDYSAPVTYRQVERIIEEPIRIRRRGCCRRRRRRCRSYCSTPAPLQPIVIPIPMQAPVEQTPYQVTEYIQDIYPPAHVFTEQVPIGYTVQSVNMNQKPSPGVILPPAPYMQPSSPAQQQPRQLVQQLPNGQIIQRPLSVGGGSTGGVQQVILQQPNLSPSNSRVTMSNPSFNTQYF